MLQTIAANWPAFALALAIGLLVAWWLSGGRGARERSRRPDVLDEGAAPAQRNQALIDAPPAVQAASVADPGPDIPAAPPEPPAAAVATVTAAEADDLRRIKGVGPKLVVLLHGLGITTCAQIAAWTDADIARIDSQLGTFAGRIRRDDWVEQAKLLTAGDTAGFEGKFGRL
ncbi:MAG: hypothetical protein LBV50_07035, partial [Novosphingobium sp.]|nr:hypothetical protein [Novosphingobium sp.]